MGRVACRPAPRITFVLEQEPDMSTAPVDRYYPGLEGVIASETAISSVEGRQGEGGLEYRGYRIEDLADVVSYEETAFLLLHGDLPTRGQWSTSTRG
jgi:citrate synthase